MEKILKNEPEGQTLFEKKPVELICIVCPRGCHLTVRAAKGNDSSYSKTDPVEVVGNLCPRGEEYGRQESTDPVRVLTALMRIRGSEKPVSVRTDLPVPKAKLLECAAEIYRTHPDAPVHRGDILIRDLCGTGSNVIATRDS